MKHVEKLPEPTDFHKWKNQGDGDWQPVWKDLKGRPDIKAALRRSLLEEQGYICCYCERRVGDDGDPEHEDPGHIEHLKPRRGCGGKYKHLELEYTNLLLSCKDTNKKGEPRQCGHAKGDWYDEALFVSPLDVSCEKRFRYDDEGYIEPSQGDDSAATETIMRLELNSPVLCERRAEVFKEWLPDDGAVTPKEEFDKFLERYDQGRFAEFWTTIQYIRDNY